MREKIYRFMQGRYGVDQLYRFIFFLAIVLMLINNFLKNPMLNLVIYALLILDIFRMLSKNHSARYAANQKYLQFSHRMQDSVIGWISRKSSGRRESIIIFTLAQNVSRRSGFQKEKERLWYAARNVTLSFRREAKRLCSDILLYTNRN